MSRVDRVSRWRRALSKTLALLIVALVVVAGVVVFFTGNLLQKQMPSTTTSPFTTTSLYTTPLAITTTPQTLMSSPVVSAKDTLKVAIGVDLDTVDPHGQTTATVSNVLRHVYETLVWRDPNNLSVIPLLAERWEVSSDGLVYTLYLRKGVKFHDGSEFNATVVKANFDRWFDPTVRVPTRSQLGPVNKTEVVDPYTLRVYLSRPYPFFIDMLASIPYITSLPVLQKFKNNTITEVVGTGPYKFVSWEKGKKIVLERFDDYWGPKPPIKRIEWYIMPEASTRLAALLAGDVDFAYNLPATDLERVKSNPNLIALTPTMDRIIFIVLVIKPNSPLADPRVRQALNYAIDKEAIINSILFGLAVPANDSFVPPHYLGYFPMQPYKYDPEKAKKLLAEAGYPNGFKMVLLHPTGRYLQDKQVAEAIQAYLANIGVQVELKTMDWPSFVATVLKPCSEKDYDAVLLGWGTAIPDAYFILFGQFHSTQATPKGLAPACYNNSEVDRYIDLASKELDPVKRAQYYKLAEEIIWRDAPWIFLYTQKNFAGKVATLKGEFVLNGENFYFMNAYFIK
ncbi:MAG: ABC transporter substrate-binding protein [Sulfolobales archaeon]